jgi:HEAT repeat protein
VHSSNHAIAAAAEVAGRLEAETLAPDLTAAFLELMKHPHARDPACKATIAIAEALAGMSLHAPKVFEKGIAHVQKEGSYGPPVDAAAPLRGVCARGLARMGYPDAMYSIVNLLADPEIPARVGAVRALADSGRPDAELLLRLKTLQGDKTEVIVECFSALLALTPQPSVEFVARYLESPSDEIRHGAALALGESRQAGALTVLQEAWKRPDPPFRRALALSIAMLRREEGVKFLLSRLREEPEHTAAGALAALALYASDDAIHGRVKEILDQRNSDPLRLVYQREWRSRSPAAL